MSAAAPALAGIPTPDHRHEIERARREDVPALAHLLNSTVPSCSPMTVWSLPWSWPYFRVLRDGLGRVIAAGAAEPVDDDRVELRGIAVSSAYRRCGLASRVVQHLIDQAVAAGQRPVCVTRVPAFFERLGFVEDLAPLWVPVSRRIAADSDRVAMAFDLDEADDQDLPFADGSLDDDDLGTDSLEPALRIVSIS